LILRFAILASPGSDPGDARARAASFAAVDGPAEIAAAARAATAPYVLLLAPGARPLPGAFGGLSSSLGGDAGVIGGAAHAADTRAFGWMLAPALLAPLPFELVPIVAPLAEAGADARARGAVDVVAPGMLLALRELLLEELPADPVAALVELCARARAAGRDVVCRPSFACEAPPLGADDRGRFAALRALAERRPELSGTHRLPPGARRAFVERELRLDGGRRLHVRVAQPPLTVLVHGDGAEQAVRRARDLAPNAIARAVADPAAALRAELRVRGDRYVLVASAQRLPSRDELDTLVSRLESAPYVAFAAPDAAALDGTCVLLALARLPQHLDAKGATLPAALESLVAGAAALRRAVRAPGYVPREVEPPAPRRATIVYLASSLPEIMRVTLDAVVPAVRADDELVAVCAANADTTRRILAAYPQLRVATDECDPLLADAANRAVAASARELIVLLADDVLLPAGALDRLRDAFARVPSLGAAFPAVAGAPGAEGVHDVAYADLTQLHALAERRAVTLAGRLEPIDVAVTPAFAVAREAFDAVGGIDPALGPTRHGIADLVLRLRAAGYGVARCDDALAHRFDASVSHNPAAAASLRQTVAAPDRAVIARGFDPARRVPFVRLAVVPRVARTAPAASHAVAVPVATATELERAAIFLTAAAKAFDASAPVRLHVLLDGDVAPADAVARIRPALAGGGKPMDETVAVRVERAADLRAWRAALDPGARVVVAAGHERAALADLTAVPAAALRELAEPALR
jgi:GT2 family glycosyltransferase